MEDNGGKYKMATFSGGCFWCMQPPFDNLPGVVSTTVGYTGGTEKNPSYHDVCYGRTDHIESIEVVYDPDKVSYEQLLDVFWLNIDPTDDGGQFVDRGRHYKTAIFYHDEEQKKIAMTTPVFSTKVGEGKSMSFVVPAEVVAAGVPKATDGNVVVAPRAKGRFAVYRYSGRWTTARENKARATLLAWIKEKELKTVGATETANYNSPMTLPFLRRNEVLVRLKN